MASVAAQCLRACVISLISQPWKRRPCQRLWLILKRTVSSKPLSPVGIVRQPTVQNPTTNQFSTSSLHIPICLSVLQALSGLNPTLVSPRGYQFVVDWNSLGFLSYIPSYYRIPGPSITALQLVQEACDALGFEFFVYMNRRNIIKFGYVDLRSDPPSIADTISQFDGTATQLSYGQELRNDKTKTLLFGENVHYMSASNRFSYFFGEEPGAEEPEAGEEEVEFT